MKTCLRVTLIGLIFILALGSDLPALAETKELPLSSPARLLTYPFLPDPEMRVLSGWLYNDGVYHGAIDYVKSRSGYKAHWQKFDVLAAAPGEACWVIAGGNNPGPLMKVQHQVEGATYETRYGHLSAVASNIPRCPAKVTVRRGALLGIAGDSSWNRCSPPCVHLHFELRIRGQLVDPYDIYGVASRYPDPDNDRPGLLGGNHYWTRDPPTYFSNDLTPPVIHFTMPRPNRWYNTDQRISWRITDEGGSGVKGFSQAWDSDPGGQPPQYTGDSGYLQLSAAGEGRHTAYVRAWDKDDNETFQTRGWFGYDPQPPANPTSVLETGGVQSDVWQSALNDPDFIWGGATDADTSVVSYNVYWGSNPDGTSATETTDGGYNPGPVAPGIYYLRVRTKDEAGNWSEWTTLFVFKYKEQP